MKYTFRLMAAILIPIQLMSCDKMGPVDKNEVKHYINIVFDGVIPVDYKIGVDLCISDGTEMVRYEGRVERRGGSSISFSKHSYEIDLNEDIPLLDLPDDDDWILNANYIDKTFLRHVVSYELFMAMNEKNEASQCEYIEVQLNSIYNGLYVLMEKLDKSSLEINGEDTSAVIFKEPHLFRESYENIIPQDEDNFHQQTFPKIGKKNKAGFIEGIRKFILTSSDAVFSKEIFGIFDMENIIDWHLLLLISNNSDGILKNYYLYKTDANTPVRIAPWDYDHSFGRDGDNELNLDERPLKIERSILFSRLLQFNWYKQLLKNRWEKLNDSGVLSEQDLKQRVIKKSTEVREPAIKNFEMWPVNSSWYYDSNNFDQEIEIMLQFIELRHRRLREYFNAL